MPDSAPAQGAQQGAAQPGGGDQQQGSTWQSTLTSVVRMFLVFQAVQYFFGGNSPFKSFFNKGDDNNVATNTDPSSTGSTTPQQPKQPQVMGDPYWQPGENLDLYIFLTTSDDFNRIEFHDTVLPKTAFKDVPFGNWDWKYEWATTIPVPKSVQQNESLYADLFLTKSGVSPDPSDATFIPSEVSHTRKPITRYMPQRKIRAEKSLLSGSSEDEEEHEPEQEGQKETEASGSSLLNDDKDLPIISYYHPNLTLALVSDTKSLPIKQLPPVLQQYFNMNPLAKDVPENHESFFPVLFPNDFWLLREHMNPVNETVDELPLYVNFYPQSHLKFQTLASLHESFSKQADAAGGASGSELDELKRMLTETSPILLATTFIVSCLHSLFEFLAFKSDVGHWRNKKELVGVSVRTILTNVFVQLVILLYLLDNNENTSWMILAGQGIGLLIEAWKITKAVDIKLVPKPTQVIPYAIEFHDKHVLTEEEKKTQEYDQLAFKYVSYFTVPSLGAYTIYSLIYESHRGWYSFIISTLTSFVYAFGFVQLIPQLIINYKLKSVAHMPMRAMTYKFFNTIVDDLFAFCIKMPTLHRLACFRDDVVFLILLWQYRVYKVDPTRANEYGQVGVSEEEMEKIRNDSQKKDQ